MPDYLNDRSVIKLGRTTSRTWIRNLDPEPNYTVSPYNLTLSRFIQGHRLPNWKARLKAKQDATTNMSATWLDVKDSSHGMVTSKWTYNPNPNLIYTNEFGGNIDICNTTDLFLPPDHSQDPTFVENLARQAFYGKLDKIAKSFDGLVFLGELRETLRLVKRPHETFRRLCENWYQTLKKSRRKYQDPRTGKFKSKYNTRWREDLGALWLEQSFGWNPAINDAKSALETYERLTDQNSGPQIRRISAGGRKYYDRSNTLGSYQGPGGYFNACGTGFSVLRGTLFETISSRYRAGVIVRTKAPSWGDKAELLGFNPQQFIPALYELFPWSFLLDYVTNTGALLQAACTRNFEYSYCNRTLVQTSEKTRVLKHDTTKPSLNGNWTFIGRNGEYVPSVHTASRKTVSRTTVSGVPLPTFQTQWDLTDGQLLNVAALLSQVGAIHPQNPRPRRIRI